MCAIQRFLSNLLICMWIALALALGSRTDLLTPTPAVALTPSLLSCTLVIPKEAQGAKRRDTLLMTRFQKWQESHCPWSQSCICAPAPLRCPSGMAVHLIR